MKKQDEKESLAKTREIVPTGKVRRIREKLLLDSDSDLAHRLQQEEFAVHYDRNRADRRESGLSLKAARVYEEQEKNEFLAKEYQLLKFKQKMEETDADLARRMQLQTKDGRHKEAEAKSRSSNLRSNRNRPASMTTTTTEETINDEQLARILQEEENRLFSFAKHFK